MVGKLGYWTLVGCKWGIVSVCVSINACRWSGGAYRGYGTGIGMSLMTGRECACGLGLDFLACMGWFVN